MNTEKNLVYPEFVYLAHPVGNDWDRFGIFYKLDDALNYADFGHGPHDTSRVTKVRIPCVKTNGENRTAIEWEKRGDNGRWRRTILVEEDFDKEEDGDDDKN